MGEGVIGESQERFIEGNLRYANMAVNVNMFNVSELCLYCWRRDEFYC